MVNRCKRPEQKATHRLAKGKCGLSAMGTPTIEHVPSTGEKTGTGFTEATVFKLNLQLCEVLKS